MTKMVYEIMQSNVNGRAGCWVLDFGNVEGRNLCIYSELARVCVIAFVVVLTTFKGYV